MGIDDEGMWEAEPPIIWAAGVWKLVARILQTGGSGLRAQTGEGIQQFC